MRSYDLLMRIGVDEPSGSAPWSISLGVSELRGSDEAQHLIDRADQDLLETRRRR